MNEKQIGFKVNDEQKELILKGSKISGQTLASYVRHSALEKSRELLIEKNSINELFKKALNQKLNLKDLENFELKREEIH